MSRNGRKRSHDEYRDRNDIGLGPTLSYMKESKEASTSVEHNRNGASILDQDSDAGEWYRVEDSRSTKRKKVRQRDRDEYPSIAYSSHARFYSFVKLGDLQNLVLYLLADGVAPQWCSVKHHANVRRVVVLMAPGLEAGMFDGKIPLLDSQPPEQNADHNRPRESAGGLASAQGVEGVSNDQSIPNEFIVRADSNHKSKASPDDYYPKKLKKNRLPTPLQPLTEIFEHVWPIITPGDSKYAKMHSPLAAMLISPIVKPRRDKSTKGPQAPAAGKTWKNERTSITEFIASTEESIESGYVIHPAHYTTASIAAQENLKRERNNTTMSDGWIDTPEIPDLATGEVAHKDVEAGSVLAGRRVLALDCEMCITSPPGETPQVFSLTRISMIDWNGDVVLDQLVKPDKPITDYLTPYSGITAAMLENVATTLEDVQKRLTEEILTPQTILVGHSLESDLNALQITFPYIVDTALLFPHPRGPPLKSSLKWLAQKYLTREIQKGHGTTGHDSVEDAKASLDLVKQKCEKGKAWGTSEASGESIFKRLGRSVRPKRYKFNQVGDDEPVTGAVIDWGEPSRGYGASAKAAIGCESDEQVVTGIKRALMGDDDDSVVPKGGVDFVFGRLRELEAYRGWWNQSKTLDNEALRNNTTSNSESQSLATVTAATISHVHEVWNSLPACTAFIAISGSGDPRQLSEMQTLHQRFKDEYKVKKWDELSVKWTDVEEQKLRDACDQARLGIGLIAVK